MAHVTGQLKPQQARVAWEHCLRRLSRARRRRGTGTGTATSAAFLVAARLWLLDILEHGIADISTGDDQNVKMWS
jgi:ferric-dicitrate binding protein FerR (iron transport regulator)